MFVKKECKFMYNENESELEETSLINEYGAVVVQSLVTSFGLDFLVKDQHGGDVDTIHNVRQIDSDAKMYYKNEKNAQDYEQRGLYDPISYHSDPAFAQKKHIAREQFDQTGIPLTDEYTGESLYFRHKDPHKNANLDHVKSAQEIHHDRGRVLAGIDGRELANSNENLKWTNEHLNKSMKADSIQGYIKKNPELDEQTKLNMLKQDQKTRSALDSKINKKYYSSTEFKKDLVSASALRGVQMGARQVAGLIFLEIWFEVVDSVETCEGDIEDYFHAVAEGIKQGYENAVKKFDTYIKKFFEGSVSGVLSSLITTLTNIFMTTAQNVVKIIREVFASLVQTARILIFNPDKYPDAVKTQEAFKVLAAGLGVLAGTLTKEALEKTPVGQLGEIGKVISTFCGTLVGGLLSCTFIKIINHLFKTSLNFNLALYYYRKQETIDTLFADNNQLLAPFCLDINEHKYKHSKNQYKTMYISGRYYAFTSYIPEKGLQPILDCYHSWEISADNFWNFAIQFNRKLNPEFSEEYKQIKDLNFVWNNFFKLLPRKQSCNRNWLQTIEIEKFNVLKKKISIIQPDVIIFCTSRKFDKYISKKFSEKTKIKRTRFFNIFYPGYNLAKIINPHLPVHTYRIRPEVLKKQRYSNRLFYLITGQKNKKIKILFLPWKKIVTALAVIILLLFIFLLLKVCKEPIVEKKAENVIVTQPKILLQEIKSPIFKADKSSFTDQKAANIWLDMIANEISEKLNKNPRLQFKINGYVADFPNEIDDIILSRKRADNIKAELIKRGISEKILVTVPVGKTERWGKEREENRAVTIVSFEE